MGQDQRNKVLIISNHFDPHVDQMIVMLNSLGVSCVRWILSTFPLESKFGLEIGRSGVGGAVETAGWEADLSAVRSVWYRHPERANLPEGLPHDEAEFAGGEVRAAINGLFRSFDWFWVNHPDAVRVSGSKILQLKVARDLGFRVPETLVTNDPAEVRRFFEKNNENIIYKPFHSGFFSSTHKFCYTTPLRREDFEHIDLIKITSGIFQERIEKALELRITVIGRQVFATEIHSQERDISRDDWRAADVNDLVHAPHELAGDIEERILNFVDHFDLAYGAMDMILTPGGEYVFLENNPSGQFGWIEDLTGLPLTGTLARMLIAGKVI